MQATIEPRASRTSAALHVSWAHAARGEVQLTASKRHRLRLHAGPPVRGRCGHEPFHYHRGDLDLIPSGMSDRWQQEGDSRALSLEVEPLLIERAAEELGKRARTLAPRHQFRDASVEHIVRSLYAAQQDEVPLGKLYLESLGLALATRLWTTGSEAAAPLRGLPKPVERRLLNYIDEHLSEDLSLLQLADVAGHGASQLKLLFKRSFGYTVHDYVIRRRVERARALVLESDRSLAQIALDVGFAHQSHMARCMRRVLGNTPGALRRA